MLSKSGGKNCVLGQRNGTKKIDWLVGRSEMKLLDTMVFVSALDPVDRQHATAMSHMKSLRAGQDTYVPTSTLTELDFVLRINGYSRNEMFETWEALAPFVGGKLTATTPTAHQEAAMLRLGGMMYFDSLITALALERNAIVVTRDVEISKRVKTEW
jgi:predicted nucleic acid-binding protein